MLDESKRVKKDLEADLITEIFKAPNEDENNKQNNHLSMGNINVKLEAKKAASDLLSYLGGSRENIEKERNKMMASTSILSNLLNKNKLDNQ
jgi:hypothetical protein